jgi:hypothetical protein
MPDLSIITRSLALYLCDSLEVFSNIMPLLMDPCFRSFIWAKSNPAYVYQRLSVLVWLVVLHGKYCILPMKWHWQMTKTALSVADHFFNPQMSIAYCQLLCVFIQLCHWTEGSVYWQIFHLNHSFCTSAWIMLWIPFRYQTKSFVIYNTGLAGYCWMLPW